MNDWPYWIEINLTCKTHFCELIPQNIGKTPKLRFLSLEKVILCAKLSFVAAMMLLSRWPPPIADICQHQKIGHPHKHGSRHQDHVSMPSISDFTLKIEICGSHVGFSRWPPAHCYFCLHQ